MDEMRGPIRQRERQATLDEVRQRVDLLVPEEDDIGYERGFDACRSHMFAIIDTMKAADV